VKDENPLDIQQKGITLTSTVLKAATWILTTCTVDVVVVWVWLTIIIVFYNIHTVTALIRAVRYAVCFLTYSKTFDTVLQCKSLLKRLEQLRLSPPSLSRYTATYHIESKV